MLQNLIPSFPWIVPGWMAGNHILTSGNLGLWSLSLTREQSLCGLSPTIIMQEGEREGEMGLDCCWFIQREADFMGFRTRFQADTVQDFGNGSRDSILYSSQLQISHLSSRFLQFPFAPYL